MYTLLHQMANPIGIIGVILVLIAYFLLNTGRWSAETFKYQFLNFLGAWFILYSLFFYWNLSSVVIEIAWITISLIGFWRLFFSKKVSFKA